MKRRWSSESPSEPGVIIGSNARALYLHGLWMLGPEAFLLAHRLRRFGIELRNFGYASLHEPPESVAARLAALLERDPSIHLVGHSLGGMIVSMAATRVPAWRGRAVLLGPPFAGSATARRIKELGLARIVLGAASADVLGGLRAPRGDGRQVVIAGTGNWGIGTLLGACPAPADGIVRLAETRLPGARRRLARSNHVGLLFDRQVAAAAATFMLTGRLPRPRAGRVRIEARAPRAD